MGTTHNTARSTLRRHRGGYTLMELAISIGVGGVLLGGMGATMTIATRIAATPMSVEPTLERSQFAASMKRDLESAMVLLEHTGGGKGIRCVVPDIDGDHRPDVIGYSWSGNRGESWIRTVNGTATDGSIEAVENLNLFYDNDYREQVIPRITQISEGELFSHKGLTSKPVMVAANSLISRAVDPRAFIGVTGGSAASFSLTKVVFYADVPSAAVGTRLRIYEASGTGWPIGKPLAETVVVSGHFSGGGKATVPIETGALSFDQPIAIALLAGTQDWSTDASATIDGAPIILLSKDNGATWNIPTDRLDLNFECWGTVNAKTDPIILSRSMVKQAKVVLQLEQSSPTSFGIGFTNRPEYCNDWIGFDGAASPIGMDFNLDGISDFDNVSFFDLKDGCVVFEGLLKGHWFGKSRDDRNSPRILCLRLRDFGNYQVGLQVHCETNGGQAGLFSLDVTASEDSADVTWETLLSGTVIPLGQTTTSPDMTIRLFIVPNNDSVTIELNRVLIGTFKYDFNSNSSSVSDIEISNDGNGAIDSFSYQLMVTQE